MPAHTLIIDSRDRDRAEYPEPGEYRVRLPRKYRDVVSARLLTAEIPLSFHVFRDAELRVALDGEYAVVGVRDGNYNATELEIELRNQLEAAFGTPFDVLLDPVTMKLTIGAGTAHVVELDGTHGSAGVLGFDARTYGPSTAVTGTRVACLSPQTYFVLDIAELNGVDESAENGGEVGAGCFAKVPFSVNAWDYVSLDNAAHASIAIPKAVPFVDRLTVRWRWHDGSVVDFNGVEHSFTIELTTRPPPEPVVSGRPTAELPVAPVAAVAGPEHRGVADYAFGIVLAAVVGSVLWVLLKK